MHGRRSLKQKETEKEEVLEFSEFNNQKTEFIFSEPMEEEVDEAFSCVVKSQKRRSKKNYKNRTHRNKI